MARIYAASSWRNPDQPAIVAALRDHGHEVYDFRNPFNGRPGFAWSEIDPEWQSWSAKRYRELLTTSPIAAAGYVSDLRAMEWADTCVLILPCGRSAHLEAGWFCGRGKRCIILTRDGEEPELMALLATDICISVAEVIKVLREKHPCGNGWSDHEDFRAAMLRRTGDPIYAPAPIPVDRSAQQLSGGGPVTEDHRELTPSGQQKGYVVLTEAERAKGFVRPVRDAYRHLKCGKITTMSRDIAQTYARDPFFYSGTFCTTCRGHFPIGEDGEFTWYENDGTEGPKVGT